MKQSTGSNEAAEMITQLETALKTGDWDTVDTLVPKAARISEIVEYATQKLNDSDPDFQDLGLSIWAKSVEMPSEDVRNRCIELMITGTTEAVRFRAAYALMAHGDRRGLRTLQDARNSEDPDIQEAARDFLDTLGD